MIAAQYQDPENARIIFFAAGGLLVLAIVLVVATILWWRSSGVEPTALAPLEVMSTRTWWNSDDETRSEQVEAVRAQLELRAGPPEAGMVVERAGDLSGVSVMSRSAGGAFVDDDMLDERADAVLADVPAAGSQRNDSEPAALARLARFDADADDEPVAEPRPAPAGPGLFDQFGEDPFDDFLAPAPTARAAKKLARQAGEEGAADELGGGGDDDIWGGPAEPRRSIDPLLNDGDLW